MVKGGYSTLKQLTLLTCVCEISFLHKTIKMGTYETLDSTIVFYMEEIDGEWDSQ